MKIRRIEKNCTTGKSLASVPFTSRNPMPGQRKIDLDDERVADDLAQPEAGE